ncbi:hypothetical protein C2G38_2047299 [Gigaspora rosea]|uniref:D-arabinono-1,4-lactone oxidase n=1 Tax=Gigaspora rosea TaxID=44941 RepID=A0A397UAQ1_9GLOM|nr:hypothetical protein C2G38_2047299 [Gigaspora rosea]
MTYKLYFDPESEDDIVKIIELAKRNKKNVRAIGMIHSPSDLPFSDGYIISMKKLNSPRETMNLDGFKAALCSLGALGIIAQVTIQYETAYLLEANQTPVKLNYVLDNLESVIHSAEHVRFWWFPHTDDCVAWKANRTK